MRSIWHSWMAIWSYLPFTRGWSTHQGITSLCALWHRSDTHRIWDVKGHKSPLLDPKEKLKRIFWKAQSPKRFFICSGCPLSKCDICSSKGGVQRTLFSIYVSFCKRKRKEGNTFPQCFSPICRCASLIVHSVKEKVASNCTAVTNQKWEIQYAQICPLVVLQGGLVGLCPVRLVLKVGLRFVVLQGGLILQWVVLQGG